MIEQQDLLDLESEYGFRFPNELKEFYLKYNGEKLKQKKVVLQEGDWRSSTGFHCFYSIKQGHSSLSKKLRNCSCDDWWIDWLIPFGYDEGGEDFCFSTRDSDYGSIYYFMSDCIDEECPENALVKVGDNFNDFINRME